ncbi:MAG: RNA polymerase sigma factor [Clostridiaceae bacterium]
MEIEKVYKLYFKDVYTFLYGLSQNKAVAEDITQDTFLKAMKNIDLFDGRKDIKAWLFTIARNTYYTEYNRQKIFSPYDLEDNVDGQTDVLDHLILKEQSILILKTLHNISEPYKEVFMLRFFGSLSFNKISLMFTKTESWARVTYYRAKKQILEEVEGNQSE